MRNEFYADRKDVIKWSFLLRKASGRRILYAAMLRPDVGKHGNDFEHYSNALPEVVAFFELERSAISPGSPRNLGRIRKLSPTIDLFSKSYEHRLRSAYFEELTMQIDGCPTLLFLDPDNGIAGKCWRGVHVCPDSLKTSWGALHRGDELAVYQHQFRDRQWREKRRRAFAESIGVPLEYMQVECHGPICFYWTQK